MITSGLANAGVPLPSERTQRRVRDRRHPRDSPSPAATTTRTWAPRWAAGGGCSSSTSSPGPPTKAGRKLVPPNVVFATHTPLTVGLAGMALSRHFGVPFVFEVRDLWPEALVNVGALRNPAAIWWLRADGPADLSCGRSHRRPVARHETGHRPDRRRGGEGHGDSQRQRPGPVQSRPGRRRLTRAAGPGQAVRRHLLRRDGTGQRPGVRRSKRQRSWPSGKRSASCSSSTAAAARGPSSKPWSAAMDSRTSCSAIWCRTRRRSPASWPGATCA